MNEYCTYRTEFSNGFYYLGKGKTARVQDGSYTGSGIKYRLALYHWLDPLNSGEITATTTLLATYPTEAEAYAAEEVLVPIELLADPYCLNMHSGGLKGRYQTASRLLRKINNEKRTVTRNLKKARAKLKADAVAQEIKQLKKKLKEA